MKSVAFIGALILVGGVGLVGFTNHKPSPKSLAPVNFKQVAHLGAPNSPRDIWEIFCGDANHNNKKEILLEGGGTYFEEHQGNNLYLEIDTAQTAQTGPGSKPTTMGYADFDSLTDFCAPKDSAPTIYGLIRLFESTTIDSFPHNVSWQYYYNHEQHTAVFCDLDKDGKKDILVGGGEGVVYECAENDSFELVWQYHDPILYGDNGIFYAVDDFDSDGRMEFVTMWIRGTYVPNRGSVFECQGDNNYVLADSFFTSLKYNNTAMFAPREPYRACDMDQDGKKEFACSGINIYIWGSSTSFFSVFECIGNNKFTEVWTDSFPQRPDWRGHDIGIGDVDGDGVDEMVCMDGYRVSVYKATGDNQYQEIYWLDLTGIEGLSYDEVRVIVYDVNQNGYAEMVLSLGNADTYPGNYQTYVYEICGQANFYSLTATPKDSCIRVDWSTTSQFANYGFRLWRADSVDANYKVIYETYDTVKLDTTLLAYGYNDSNVVGGVTYYYKVQAKALNTDSIFYGPVSAVALGVEEKPLKARELTGINRLWQNSPNPFSDRTEIKYQVKEKSMVSLKIYNNNAQLVKTLLRQKFHEPGIHTIRWDGRDERGKKVAAGVYYYQLQVGGFCETKKMIVLR